MGCCNTVPWLAEVSPYAQSCCSRLVEFHQSWCFSDRGLCCWCRGMQSDQGYKDGFSSSLGLFSFSFFFFLKTTKDKLFSDVLFGGLHEDSVRKSQLNSSWQRCHCQFLQQSLAGSFNVRGWRDSGRGHHAEPPSLLHPRQEQLELRTVSDGQEAHSERRTS